METGSRAWPRRGSRCADGRGRCRKGAALVRRDEDFYIVRGKEKLDEIKLI